MSKKHSMNSRKFPAYSLPKIYGWHLIPRQKITDKGRVFKYFGMNWWDLLYSGKLGLKTGSVTLKTKDVHAIIFINLGADSVKMKNTHTGDIYKVMPGKRSTVNNTFDRTITFTSSSKKNEIHVTRIGNMFLVLLQVEQIRSGKSFVKTSDLFSDFLLMSGIPDKEQYLTTLGLEEFTAVEFDGLKPIEEEDAKSEWIEFLLDQWKICNPRKREKTEHPIPKKIHWIWLSRYHDGREFGAIKPRFHRFMETWIERNPDFEFNLWTDNPDIAVPTKFQEKITVRGPDQIKKQIKKLPEKLRKNITYMFRNHPNVGARSDTLRQVVLYTEGGLYADINDAACLGSMTKICNKFDFFIGMEPVMYVNNAIIGARKGHIINKRFIAFIADRAHDFVDEWVEIYADEEDQESKDDYIVSTTGPIAMSSIIFGVLKEKELKHTLILPSSFVYPNYWVKEPSDTWLKPVSITAHYDARDFLA